MYYKGAAWKGGGVVPPSSIWGHMGPHLPIPNMDPTLQDATIKPPRVGDCRGVELHTWAPWPRVPRPIGRWESLIVQ